MCLVQLASNLFRFPIPKYSCPGKFTKGHCITRNIGADCASFHHYPVFSREPEFQSKFRLFRITPGQKLFLTNFLRPPCLWCYSWRNCVCSFHHLMPKLKSATFQGKIIPTQALSAGGIIPMTHLAIFLLKDRFDLKLPSLWHLDRQARLVPSNTWIPWQMPSAQ